MNVSAMYLEIIKNSAKKFHPKYEFPRCNNDTIAKTMSNKIVYEAGTVGFLFIK
jgi:hypothetical protein